QLNALSLHFCPPRDFLFLSSSARVLISPSHGTLNLLRSPTVFVLLHPTIMRGLDVSVPNRGHHLLKGLAERNDALERLFQEQSLGVAFLGSLQSASRFREEVLAIGFFSASTLPVEGVLFRLAGGANPAVQ